MLRACSRQGQNLLKRLSAQSCPFSENLAEVLVGPQSDASLVGTSTTYSPGIRTWGCSSQKSRSLSTDIKIAAGLLLNQHQKPLLAAITSQRAAYASGGRQDSDPGSSTAPAPDFNSQDASQPSAASDSSLPAVLEEDADEFEGASGQRPMSLEEYDAILDRWGELLQEGKLDEVMDLMEYAYGGFDPLPPLESMLAAGEEDEGKAERRAREQALQEDFARQRVQVIDDLGRSYATGKRKTSIARVWLKPGSGIISVNSKGFDAIFPTIERRQDVLSPFAITGTYGSFDVKATVRGGGCTGQAQALRHGISKALQLYDPGLRPELKSAGYLTRDARVVERKKPGRAKARKSFQWVKR